MTPDFPLISIYKNRGLNIFTNDILFRKISTYTFISQTPTENKFYDKYGKYWTLTFVNDKVTNNFLTRLLSTTVFNPAINVELKWKEIGTYSLNDLKNEIFICVDKDDDVITQFEEGNIIKKAVECCDNFEEIIVTLNKYVFKVDENQLRKE